MVTYPANGMFLCSGLGSSSVSDMSSTFVSVHYYIILPFKLSTQ